MKCVNNAHDIRNTHDTVDIISIFSHLSHSCMPQVVQSILSQQILTDGNKCPLLQILSTWPAIIRHYGRCYFLLEHTLALLLSHILDPPHPLPISWAWFASRGRSRHTSANPLRLVSHVTWKLPQQPISVSKGAGNKMNFIIVYIQAPITVF